MPSIVYDHEKGLELEQQEKSGRRKKQFGLTVHSWAKGYFRERKKAKKRREEQQLEQEKAVGAEAGAIGQKEEAALTFASHMIEEPNSKAARLLVPGTIIESVR